MELESNIVCRRRPKILDDQIKEPECNLISLDSHGNVRFDLRLARGARLADELPSQDDVRYSGSGHDEGEQEADDSGIRVEPLNKAGHVGLLREGCLMDRA